MQTEVTVSKALECKEISCGLDVHKDKIDACVLKQDGTIFQQTFSTMRSALFELCNWIVGLGCLNVLMESTSVYWMPIFEILEDVEGMDVGLGNARHMKNVPGRPKTDKSDAKWIAKLCMFGLILKSFIVGREFRELREFTRYHKKLVQDKAKQVNRIEKLLQMNGFKLSSVLSDITGVSGLKVLHKLCEQGYVTEDDIILAMDKRVKKTTEEIGSAINGDMKKTSRFILKKMLNKLETCDEDIDEMYNAMVLQSAKYSSEIQIIDSIPGLGELSAIYLIAELSTDMSSFTTSKHIAAWAGLAPKDSESAGKIKSSKTKKANQYVKSILVECAWALTRTRGNRLSNWYWRNVGRLGKKKAITAVARKLLCYIYAMLKSGTLYDTSLDTAEMNNTKAKKLDTARKIVDGNQKYTFSKDELSQVVTENSNLAPSQLQSQGKTFCENNDFVGEATVIQKKRGRPKKQKEMKESPHNLAYK